jgi:hypothetical protein
MTRLPALPDRLIGVVQELAGSGPRWHYRYVTEHGEYVPVERVAAGSAGRAPTRALR